MQTTPSSVFITGATGFIGRHLTGALLGQGHAVRAMIRPGRKADKRLPSGCQQIPVHLTDADRLSDIVAESSALIYCAGSVRGRIPADFSTANVEGVRAIIEAMASVVEPPPLLLVSSLAAGRPELSDYSHSKYEGEQQLRASTNLPWTIIRPPAVYGPGDREMLPLFKMARRGLLVHAGPGDQRVSLIHVKDLAGAVVAWLASAPRCLHKTYTIDDGRYGGYDWVAIGKAVSVRNVRTLKLPRLFIHGIARLNLLLSSVLGYSPMLTPGKVKELVQPVWVCDNTEYSADTGWKPEIDLCSGVRLLFDSASKISPD